MSSCASVYQLRHQGAALQELFGGLPPVFELSAACLDGIRQLRALRFGGFELIHRQWLRPRRCANTLVLHACCCHPFGQGLPNRNAGGLQRAGAIEDGLRLGGCALVRGAAEATAVGSGWVGRGSRGA
eukprot:15180876-Alexandrium_andersonii.AAC.1